ncbi:MAG: PhzF family phenazine biosynthesis protein [Ekhidna sp.]|uniref:PhzF family phenazine biosynthesis protein n=1 Tax=Ekhidna sp. TaxID=2608089 RepID=UPI0032EE68A7
MKLPIYQVDAFTDHLFAGNPAAVVPIGHEWPIDDVLQKIAIENNLSETAFFQDQGDEFELRWFTPEFEIDLCGHATLASAHVIFNHLGYDKDQINFETMSGPLTVKRKDHLLQLDFPSRKPEPAEMNEALYKAFTNAPKEVLKSRDYVLVYDTEAEVRALKVDPSLLNPKLFNKGGIICTAPGDGVDFVSRFFFPGGSVFEDPVTGSSHCSLIPYWSEKLGKKEMIAYQLSERKGYLNCTDLGDRVLIAGNAVTYMTGEIEV